MPEVIRVEGAAARILYDRYLSELARLLWEQYRRGAEDAVKALAHGEACSWVNYGELTEAEREVYLAEAIRALALLNTVYKTVLIA